MLTLEIMLFCNQNVNGGEKKVHLRLFVFVHMALSFVFSLAPQFKGVDQRAVKDISKLRFSYTGPTKI